MNETQLIRTVVRTFKNQWAYSHGECGNFALAMLIYFEYNEMPVELCTAHLFEDEYSPCHSFVYGKESGLYFDHSTSAHELSKFSFNDEVFHIDEYLGFYEFAQDIKEYDGQPDIELITDILEELDKNSPETNMPSEAYIVNTFNEIFSYLV